MPLISEAQDVLTSAKSLQLETPQVVAAVQAAAQWVAGALGAMAVTFGLIVRWMMARLDRKDDINERAMEALVRNDAVTQQAVAQFKEAVEHWRRIEIEETRAHAALMSAHETHGETLQEIVEQLRYLNADSRRREIA